MRQVAAQLRPGQACQVHAGVFCFVTGFAAARAFGQLPADDR